MSHIIYTNESRHTHAWVMSHRSWASSSFTSRKMSHVSYINESCPYTNEACHTYEWVISQMGMSHVAHTNESCHTHEWVMSHRSWASSSFTGQGWCWSIRFVAVCCSVPQCVAVCCGVLQCAAVCCSVLQCVAFLLSLEKNCDLYISKGTIFKKTYQYEKTPRKETYVYENRPVNETYTYQ